MKRQVMNMFSVWWQKISGRSQSAILPLAFLGMCTMNGVGLAQQSVQPSYPSAAEATRSLFQAVQGGHEQNITTILGGPSELASSQDEAQDKVDRRLFTEKYQEMHRLGHDSDGTMTLYIGAEKLAIPDSADSKGVAVGASRSRSWLERSLVPENPATTSSRRLRFAANLLPMKKRYRTSPSSVNPTESFPASLVARAADKSTSKDPVRFHGYYFQILAASPAGGSKTNGKFLVRRLLRRNIDPPE